MHADRLHVCVMEWSCPGALLVYDITDNSSFVKVKNWVKELRSQLGKSVTLAIIGNKVDLEKSRAVNKDEALRFVTACRRFILKSLHESDDGPLDCLPPVTRRVWERSIMTPRPS